MTNEEAKFILSAYRSGGQDAQDSHFSDALSQTRRDPALSRWFAQQQALDAAIGERCRALPAPAGLRQSILTGARASRRKAWWQQPAVLAAAATLAILLTVSSFWRSAPPRPLPVDQFTRLAVADIKEAHQFSPRHHGTVAAWLTEPANAIHAGLPMTPEDLRADHCRAIRIAGVEVFEICFKRDAWYHIYIARRADIEAGGLTEILFQQQGRMATATWSDARYVYVLATEAGISALKQLL